MFIFKVMYVNLCMYSVHCAFEDSYDDDASKNDAQQEYYYENNLITREFNSNLDNNTTESGKLNSTIETSVAKYQESKASEESAEYKTLIDYPYVASIQRQGSHYATGALVDKRWVLSVAGDFYNVRESIKLFRVRLGSVDCKRGGSVFPIKTVRIHPSYVHGKPGYDLALIRLAVPVVTSCVIQPIALSEHEGRVSKKFTTAYWPRIIVNGKMLPASAKERVKFTSMRTSKQTLISSPECAQMMQGIHISLKSSLCLKPLVTLHSVCVPDAGAPVVAKDGLLGITSGWVHPGCSSNSNGSPTLVTRVTASIRSWMETQLGL